ncbi:16S rRNA (cytosine(967)-C(5))-methyltransferase RsmB [Vagococcus elongatus]|uniref:16S rRNA (cytosine(967)-C(5))-methyltransferase n=1 Tax=Vagococcus elongatus TaxID=180344 RepID=A0A430AYE7_9ENTE|nr:16S rRNA (cytosine(967)-C(5))-methyltransferase RsmB [Vagococcus elongatus]RSU13100.1 16S rRNA (cytosine(967)-C(5))-methyltransferase [Vagococcus elongatus]
MAKKKKISAHIKHNPRFVAMQLLVKVAEQQAYSNLLIDQGIREGNLSSKDGRLMTEIVYGTISRKITLEYYLHPFIKKAKTIDPWVKQLLLLSLYQLCFLDRVPEHAIVNDAVEIGKLYGNPGIGKFINGVLRTILRSSLPKTEEIKDKSERLSTELSLPVWLIDKLIEILGETETIKLGESLFQPSRASARINKKQLTREKGIEMLTQEGYDVAASSISPVGIVGKSGFLAGSNLFKTGAMAIQDESSMLVAPGLDIQADHLVLDACAAPGGKTTHIAQYLEAEKGGKVIALDIHQHKTKLIEENSQRQRVADVVEIRQLDARKVPETFSDESFDRILVDAPCSGLGLLRRKPDIKYSKTLADFEKLPQIQLEILESVAKKVKQWGIITYSTCTILPEENEKVIQTFIANHPEFEMTAVKGAEQFAKNSNGYVTLYPHEYGTDGFFICNIQRRR